MRSEDVRPSKPRILLVEDDDATRIGYAELLECRGFSVDAVATTAAAITAIKRQVPDVIVTDVMLPDGDGLSLAAQCREQPATAHVPILGITAHWSADARARAKQAGVAAFLLKPSAPAHVVAEIYRVLANEEEEEEPDFLDGENAQTA